MQIKTLQLGHMDNNCYVIFDDTTRDAAIIDAPAEPRRILSYLEENSLECKYILLTHSHYDHIGALDMLKQVTGAQIGIHALEVNMLNNASANMSKFAGGHSPVSRADMILNDGDILSIGGIGLQCIHTPGHTVGSMCFYAGGVLFSGDTLFHTNIGRCDLEGGSYDVIKKSIRGKLYILPDDTIVYPGHGEDSLIGYEKKHNDFVRSDWEYEY